jgi:hypothetical protein
MAARSGKNQTGPQPAVPAPLVKFDSDEQMHTVVAALMRHHQEQGELAVGHEQNVARLDAEIAEAKRRLDDLMAERLREDASARQRRQAEDGFAKSVAATGAPYPKRVEQLPGAPVWREPYGPVQPLEAATTAAMHEQVWNGQTAPQTGSWAHPAGDPGQQPSVWDKPLDPQQEARLDRLAALKDADPNPDPEL